ncbi:pyrophosphatase PpaX [Salipaludibacillus sp. HK11]|uniref:pyrophosphatase PpaX n=1 Tax=Salipaludibacillus sp. HK11 TaxID=3394320 RepID=UPI0039FDA294
MTKKINTILFDLDGTLINTIDLIVASFLYTMEKYYPGEYKREDVVSFIGPPLAETFKNLDPLRMEEMMTTYRTFNHQYHDELVKEYEGVKETLEELSSQGYKMAIVTTKRRETAVKGLELMGLEHFFPVVISIDEVTKYKPDPQPLNMALEKLGSSSDEAIMIGDSEHDILGGINTGTKTAGVAWSVKGRDYLESYNPDVMLDNMMDLVEYLAKTNGVLEDS